MIHSSLINNFGRFGGLFSAITLKFVHTQVKMSDWQVEKEKFLAMSTEEKRRHYKTTRHFTVDDIPTWKIYGGRLSHLPEAVPRLDHCEVYLSRNRASTNKVSIFRGDITTLEIDCIVNAANSSLLGGGGVDGAIHRAAGPSLKEECRTLHGCGVGEAKITGGYKLPAKYVIHTVGPQGEQPDRLSKCYKNSLDVMASNDLRTIAFPCISTGIYGYPVEPASHVAAYEVKKYLDRNGDQVDRVIFCVFFDEDEKLYQKILQSYFPLD